MVLFLLTLVFLLASGSAHAQTAEDFFNPEVLHEIRMDVHPTDWALLRQNFQLNTYYPADVHWLFNGRQITAEQVGIRSRGLGSRNGVKPGLLVNVERYGNSPFLGLRSFVLRNNVQDPSMLREHLGMTFMRRMGVAAPRTAFTRLFVNGDYWGLYTIVESIDTVFLQRNFRQQNGYLYSYDYVIDAPPYLFEYRGPEPAFYTPLPFRPETHEKDPDPAPLVAMIRTMNQAADAAFFAAMSQYLDLRKLARYLAADAFIAEEDSIVGDFGLNNFYIYRFEGSNLFQFIAWDKSQVLIDVNRSVWTNLHTNVLTRRSFDIAEVRAAFVNAVLESADTAGSAGGWLEQEIVRTYTQVRGAVLEDSKKLCYLPDFSFAPCSNEQFENSVVSILRFSRGRAAIVVREVLGNQ